MMNIATKSKIFSLEQLEILIEKAYDILVLFDQDRKEFFVSSSVTRILGYTPEEIIRFRGVSIMHPDDKEKVLAAFLKLQEIHNYPMRVEHRMRHKKGHWVHLEAIGLNMVSDPAINCYVVTSRNITDRRKAELAREKLYKKKFHAEKKYKTLFDTSIDGIFKTDYHGYILDANKAMLNMVGYQYLEEAPKWHEAYTPESFHETDQKIIKNQLLKKGYTEEYEKELLTKTGEKVPVSIKLWLNKEEYGNPTIWGLVRNISERKYTEESLRYIIRRSRQINKQKLEAREKERSTIATRIHDDIGQYITALKLDLGWISENLDDPSLCRDKIRNMMGVTDTITKHAQKLTGELKPYILERQGLKATIQWYCQDWSERTGIECGTELEFCYLNKHTELALFRILQEAMTNIVRHACATRVKISLAYLKDKLLMSVKDNGRGIDPSKMDSIYSHGLHGMQERAEMCSGELRITSDNGTNIEVIIPIDTSR